MKPMKGIFSIAEIKNQMNLSMSMWPHCVSWLRHVISANDKGQDHPWS